MNSTSTSPSPLQAFIQPMLGLPAWGVKQGYGSFLTLEFGSPRLEVTERNLTESGLRKSAYVHGQWHLWIYCCHWRTLQDGTQVACSEDDDQAIGKAAAILNAQGLVSVHVAPDDGRSTFTFDLGGSLETWPYEADPTAEQWIVATEAETFVYRADGRYACGPSTTPPDQVHWLPHGATSAFHPSLTPGRSASRPAPPSATP